MTDYCIELDFYLQGFRLHQRMTKAANDEAQKLLTGLQIPRAQGLLAFTQLIAKLNGWMSWSDAKTAVDSAKKDIGLRAGQDFLKDTSVATAITRISSLNGESSANDMADCTIRYYGTLAAAMDDQDFDNHWSKGTALLYADKDADASHDSYEYARTKAKLAPHISRNSLKVDRADRKFYTAPPDDEGLDLVRDSIKMIQEAIQDSQKHSSEDTKWRRWNWSLGWAFYELAYYEDSENHLSQSLATLLQIQNPHDLIIKNIIAGYAALGKTDLARQLAVGFLSRNPGYTLAIEDHWPYDPEVTVRLDRWKGHLKAGGLPD